MATFNSIDEAREFFKQDKFAGNAGAVLEELEEDYCICSLLLKDEHRNAYGGVMGGVIFTLADFAFAVLSNNIHSLTVAQNVNILYLSAPKGDKLIAKATCRKMEEPHLLLMLMLVMMWVVMLHSLLELVLNYD